MRQPIKKNWCNRNPYWAPWKKQKHYYSGKKKRHTLKTQVVVSKASGMIICTSFCNGKTHDFHLFKKSRLPLRQTTQVIVDTGYLGIHKIHSHSELPKKKSKYHPLTDADKEFNQTLASVRVLNENVIGCIKRFRIISDRYRNRRKRFALRFNLIDLCCQ